MSGEFDGRLSDDSQPQSTDENQRSSGFFVNESRTNAAIAHLPQGRLHTMTHLENLFGSNLASVTYECRSMFHDAFQELYKFYQSQTMCDVTLVVGSRSFRCHRIVLACVSTYFRAMFTSQMSEAQSNSITIHDLDEAAFELLIQFAYTARIKFTTENVQTLLYTSSILQMESVTTACGEFMKTHLHPTNCIAIRTFAEQHGRQDLVARADAFARDNFLAVMRHEDFLNISPSHLIAIIHSSDLNVSSEKEVYEAVIGWVKHKQAERLEHLPTVLREVKLVQLPARYLMEKVCQEEIIKRSMECRDLLDEAKNYHMSVTRAESLHSEQYRPRKSYAGVIFCVGGREASGDPFRSIEAYNLRKNNWLQVSEMTTRRRHVGVVSFEGKLCAVGGHDGSNHLSTGEMFDSRTNSWTSIAPMTTPRRGIGLAWLGGAIYAIGGLDDSTCFNTVDRYDPESNTWSLVHNLTYPRGGVCVAAAKGYLYALGGNDGATSLGSCERYNPHLNKWTLIASMNKRRAGAGCAKVNGKIYMIGGFDDNAPLDSVECYDLDTDAWTLLASMSCPRGGVGGAALAGRIYAVGGHDGTDYLNSVEAYDPQSDTWTRVSNISSKRAGAGVATVQCQMDCLPNMSTVSLSPAADRL